MFQVKVDDQFLDLPPEITFSFQQKGVIFQQDFIQGIFSRIPLRIPSSHTNRVALGFPNEWDSIDFSFEKPCGLYLEGALVRSGVIQIETANDRFISCNLAFGSSSLDFLTQEISSFDLGTVSLGNNLDQVVSSITQINNKTWPNAKIAFPAMFMPNLLQDSEDEGLSYSLIANNNIGGQKYNHTGNTLYNQQVIIPQIYLLHVLERCFENHGFKLVGSFVQDPELRTLLLANNKVLSRKEKTFHFHGTDSQLRNISHNQTLVIPDEILDTHDLWSHDTYLCQKAGTYTVTITLHFTAPNVEPGNSFNSGNLYIDVFDGTSVIQTKPIQVFQPGEIREVTTSFDFSATLGHVGASIQFKLRMEFNEQHPQGPVDYDKTFTTSYSELIINNFSENNLDRFGKEVVINQHVPKVTLAELIKNLPFFIVLRLDEASQLVHLDTVDYLLTDQKHQHLEKLQFQSRKINNVLDGFAFRFDFPSEDAQTEFVLEDPPTDSKASLSRNQLENPEIDSTYKTDSPLAYYIGVLKSGVPAFKFYAHGQNDLIIGKGEREFIFSVTPVFETLFDGAVLPYIDVKGKAEDYGQTGPDMAPRLMFYRGVHNTYHGESYAFAGTSIYHPESLEKQWDYELKLDGEHGVYQKFLKAFSNLLASGVRHEILIKCSVHTWSKLDTSMRQVINHRVFWIEDSRVKVSNGQARLTIDAVFA